MTERRVMDTPAGPAHSGEAGRHGRVARLVERIEEGTPAGRDRSVDALRALALLGVIAGHWLVGALVLGPDGGLTISSPLRALPELAPASWFLQMLGLFFLVGGYAAARSWGRAEERGSSYAAWLRDRIVRLSRPVVAVAGLSTLAFGLLASAGVPATTLRSWVVLLVQPFWFLGVYAVATALTSLVLAADRRFGVLAAAVPFASVALVDVARYGPWQDAVPDWIGLANVVPAWLVAYQLGVSWATGRLSRATAWLLFGGGVALFVTLVTWFGYPGSMVGVPGADRSNSHPPSMLVVALAATQSSAAVLLRDRISALMRRPRLWAAAALVNLGAMSILCWHHVALAVVSIAAASVGGVPGLSDEPSGVGWVLTRLAWLPVLAAVLVGFVAVSLRFDRPWRLPAVARTGLGVLAGAFVVVGYALW